MNTSLRFLIPTILIALGFILSCNDGITSADEEEPGVKKNTSVGVPDSPNGIASTPNPTPKEPEPEPEPPYNIDDIDPEELSKQIKEVGEKVKELEQENTKHYDEYHEMVKIQKQILEEIKRRKMIMRFKPVGTEEQKKAQKDFEDEKKYGKEKLKILKEKNILLHKISKSLAKAREEQMDLQKKQEYFLKKQKEKKEKENKKQN
ncbi:hypothetical protein [Blattabacterium cuenoti]|uniref:hypothetical protein n=1 Tax=Blattabacterium cuenoti TaxID=1653831 RepID=UPI00163BEDD3|nr:hypothetical protein [Blattabacterium cuenoti]